METKSTSKHFLAVHNLDKKLIHKFLNVLERKSSNLFKKWSFLLPKKRKIKIALCTTKKEFCKKVGLHIPWSVGWGNAYQGIILNLRKIEEVERIIVKNYKYFTSNKTLTFPCILHELTHVFTTNLKIPMWLHEGLANYYSKFWGNNAEEVFKKNLKKVKIFPFSKLTVRFDKIKNIVQAQLQSLQMAAFLIKRCGEEKIFKLIKKVRKTGNFKESFLKTYGFPIKKFEEDFKRRYCFQ